MELLQSYGVLFSIILNVVLFLILENYGTQGFNFKNVVLQRTWRALTVVAVILFFVSSWYFIASWDYTWDKKVSLCAITALANFALSTIITITFKWIWKK